MAQTKYNAETTKIAEDLKEISRNMNPMSINEMSQYQRNYYQLNFQARPRYAYNPIYMRPIPRPGNLNKCRPRFNTYVMTTNNDDVSSHQMDSLTVH